MKYDEKMDRQRALELSQSGVELTCPVCDTVLETIPKGLSMGIMPLGFICPKNNSHFHIYGDPANAMRKVREGMKKMAATNNKNNESLDNNFAIAINSNLEKLDIVAAIKETFPDYAEMITHTSMDLFDLSTFPDYTEMTAGILIESRNTLIIQKNDLHDPNKINEEDGRRYYRYKLSVLPTIRTAVEYQRDLAGLLLECLRSKGFQAEIIYEGDFDENE